MEDNELLDIAIKLKGYNDDSWQVVQAKLLEDGKWLLKIEKKQAKTQEANAE